MQLQQLAGQAVLSRAVALGALTNQRFFAKALELFLRDRLGDVTQRLQRPRTGEQEISAHEVREAEIGMLLKQRVDAPERLVEPVGLDRLENRRKPVLRRRIAGGGSRGEGGEQERGEAL